MQFFTKPAKILLLQSVLVAAAGSVLAQKAAPAARASTKDAAVQKIQVGGIIKDAATGKPLPGINISVAGFSAALADDKGAFKIDVPRSNSVLIISGPGYQRKEIALMGHTSVNVDLFEESYNSAYSLVTLPYGLQSKNNTPYAVSPINTQGSWDRPAETPDTYLQGRVAGLDAVRRSGTPDIGADLNLRGFNSLFATTQPLVIVDGMIYDTGNYGNSMIAGHVSNKFADIDIKDIDNVTVIKDGAAMYGTRGANGVILITTGRAKDVATRLDFSAYGGYNSNIKQLPVMNAADYRIYLADLLKTAPGMTDATIQSQPYFNDNPNPDYYTYHQNTNWQNLVTNSGYSQNYYLKVSGGDNIATYALSMGYLKTNGLTDNTGLTRYETRFNANLNLSTKLVGKINVAFTRSQQDLRDQGEAYNTNPLYLALVKAPFLSPYEVSSTGAFSPNVANSDIFGISNPLAAVSTKVQDINRSYRFFGSASFDYILSKKLTLSSLLGLTFDKVRENIFIPANGIAPQAFSNFIAADESEANVQRFQSIYNDTRLAYKTKLNPSQQLSANLGFRYAGNSSESDNGIGYNTASDSFVTLGGTVNSTRNISGSLGKWNWLNTYLNADYSAFDKYFLSFNLAVDGSSRFGTAIPGSLTINGLKFAALPSLSAAWLISSEKFMANYQFIESLKLRASYGFTGNDDIGNYTAKTYYVSQNFVNREGLVRGNIGDPALKWETTSKLNLGIDASVLNERLTVSIDAYRDKTFDMLILQPAITASGFNYTVSNGGSMRNDGIELGINGRLIDKTAWKWDMGINIAANRNKVLSLPLGSFITNYGGATILTATGLPANLFYGYKTNGIFRSDAEAAASGLSYRDGKGNSIAPQGGDVKFADVNNDKVIDSKDMQVIGNPNPNFLGAYTNTLTYKRWTLSTMFTFSFGNQIYNSTRASLESFSGAQNQTQIAVNRWRNNGQATDVPRAAWGDPAGNARFSDRWIEDGSYLRLKNVALSYNIPVKGSLLRSATVYATGTNVFVLTHYLGYDPEFSAASMPFARGVDTGLEPQFRSAQLGVRIGL
ncbi:SusC/RagA family TonB-linked outer membrane protein [Mucilaginibacter sp. PPCGB 2223]|uniref:SusC/RagA family TonB-linked outer membrane protein n=1 Tax=Mucilaginibacter sp. PPCGB 2223 TaxID=1886027 RepID=UPI000824B4F0|nr:SusC/RagA family TonB-linked outer membrane protein [Mucilaginibacter sp. PPCGB 2223]OCX52129.1 SusC/RagA family TonB-linked outer membrane protein [Mucilaginibacter sp. PPCGB 2223]